MMAHWWYSERRRSLEKDLLRQYLNRLHEQGIKDYNWEQLWYDYRLSVIESLYVPALSGGGEDKYNWYPQLEKATSAFEDLDCAELLT
jgi:hypothetical protein